VRIRHDIEVKDILYPSNVSELKPAEVRELAKRKGVVKRKVVIGTGDAVVSEAEFVA